MADSLAIIANGSRFQRGDGGSPEVFTDVPEVSDIVPGSPQAPTIDVSHLLSTAREKRAGLPDTGQMTATMNYLPGNAVQNAMRAEAGLNVVRHYRILFADGINGFLFTLILATFSTTGYVVDGKIQAVATFEISGAPTVVP